MKHILIALALVCPLFAQAGKPELAKITNARKACNAAATSQLGYDACEDTASDALDKELNTDYQAALKDMDAPTAEKFKIAERAWLAYRDAQVNYVGQTFDGGNGQGLEMASVSNDLTAARIGEILDH